MRIIGSRQQFIADHSSTNYLFFAAKPLSKESRAVVSKLSSHVDVGSRTAEITYNYEFSDLGDDRRKKFLQHFDVEVRESYDWWTLSVMLEPAKLPEEISLEDYEVEEEASLTFEKQGKRVRLCFDGWHQDYSESYDEFGQDAMEGLAELGLKLREEIYAGKTDALKVMRRYCAEGEIKGGRSTVSKKLAAILEVV
ncbi:MAG: hypothetical protein ACREAM_25460 [Blastocatellia bacterium]